MNTILSVFYVLPILITLNLEPSDKSLRDKTHLCYHIDSTGHHGAIKSITIFCINNITNEKIATISIQANCQKKKFVYATGAVGKNHIDHINWVKKTEISIQDNSIVLHLYLNDESDSIPKENKAKWIGVIKSTIRLGLTSDGNLVSLRSNSNETEPNVRFGGKFLDQSKGIFETMTVPY